MNARDLIEEALHGVQVAPCGRCKGFGVVGLESLKIVCPECRGCGRTTTTEELEVRDATEPHKC